MLSKEIKQETKKIDRPIYEYKKVAKKLVKMGDNYLYQNVQKLKEEWGKMKQNCNLIIQFGSTDDPFIPWSEMQTVADALDVELHRYEDKGHFMSFQFPELVEVVNKHLKR